MEKEKITERPQPLEKKLWAAADKLRKNMDAAEYKHVVLGLIFSYATCRLELPAWHELENSSPSRAARHRLRVEQSG